ncbi:isoleucine--tRNA ligase, mitochondrial-like [Panonychus citri]|uniref:isoleucine--tRNA ligase, mitochondrial-like n=1 Tax=Panonychus citri TaxID=50023 RepID=UPI002307512E|nr:isoleucine--tRNA ligase, mitochondrial-like [Panonychus citri]
MRNGLFKRYYSTKNSSKRWSQTVTIPKSDLPNRRTPKSETDFLEKSCFKNVYSQQLNRNCDKKFILHDGPPYANGSIHFGHVINKTLKDIICRYKMRQGYQVNFIPGWDCHGLPIELKVFKDSDKLTGQLEPLEIRSKAKQIAQNAIADQVKVFKRMGIAADWDSHYTTFSNHHVVNQLDSFKNLYQKKLIHRSFLPIYFSPSNKTTLAESELEYNQEHVSPSIFFQFKVNHQITRKFDYDIYALIWTTTPWTLPANQAIAFSPDIKYALTLASGLSRYFIIAQETIPMLESKIGSSLIVESILTNEDLENFSYSHPMKPNSSQPFLRADYVTISKGTGLVHCAPNHGREDFDLARKHGLQINCCLVDDNGNFITGIDSRLDGKSVIDHGSEIVMDLLKRDIVHREKIVHSYPYDWRSGKPVIIKTSLQWFINVTRIREKCLTELDQVQFFPPGIKNKISDEISKRPDWCISRQRIWGVPIPVFYHRTDLERINPIISSESIDYLVNHVKEKGIDTWWESPVNQLIPENICQSLKVNSNDLVTGRDIFDVWFDSGMTWNSVLKGNKMADLYLEGVDQCHGWFQTSLLLSVALRDKAPYKSVYVHGFAVDSNGHKMSKSIGNVIDPLPLIESKYGCDVIRLFIARYGSHHGNVKVDDDKLKSINELLLKFRNVLKFCLGSLADFDCSKNYNQSNLINRYMANQIWHFNQLCQEKYSNNDFRSIVTEVTTFLEDFSSFYLKIVKDSLYCDSLDSIDRRSTQTVINYLLETLNNFLSPIIPFLFEEINLIRQKDDNASSCLLQGWFECPVTCKNDQVLLAMGIIRRLKETIDNETEDVKHFGKPFTITIVCHRESDYQILKAIGSLSHHSLEHDMAKILQVSSVQLIESINLEESADCDKKIECQEDFPFTLLLNKSKHLPCPRCRRYLSNQLDHLCDRCNLVINNNLI